MNLPYNPNDKKSIIEYAKRLRGKTLRDACDLKQTKYNRKGKGNFGQILEEFYFQYKPNSVSEPDFKKVGLELKSSPLKKLKNNEFRSKERLVLNIINFFDIVKQNFENSSFLKKNSNLLLVFYLFQSDLNLLDYSIHIVDEWIFSGIDLEIIKRDWKFIKQKIADGKAHELSEGDTFYLGACTKGANSKSIRKQPFSIVSAKQRAFSLKQGYVNHILASLSNDTKKYGRLINHEQVIKDKSIEELVLDRFKSYIGMTTDEIIKLIKTKPSNKAKNFHSSLIKGILGISPDSEIEEFKKADITLKVIKVNAKNNIRENISFKAFKYTDLIKENWENSSFKEDLEHKFLFVFFKQINGDVVLVKTKFWNMPFKDIQKAKKVWLHTKAVVKRGEIIKEILKNGKRKSWFIKKTQSSVAHVRPHANNINDTYKLSIKDQLTNLSDFTKHSFWLNNTYIRDEVYLKP